MSIPFRLQSVLRVRQAQREAARGRLAEAIRADATLSEHRARIDAELAGLLEERRTAVSGADVAWLISAGRYELTLHANRRDLEAKAQQLANEIDRRRAALAEAERGVRALETLRDRAEQEARRIERRREAKRLDEHAANKHSRQQLLAPNP